MSRSKESDSIRKMLGIGNVPARINRVIPGSNRIYAIWIDSSAPEMPITKATVVNKLPKVGFYRDGWEGLLPMSPLMDLDDFYGNISPATFTLIDLAGKREFWSLSVFEESSKRIEEAVYVSDFRKFGMSDFTKKFYALRKQSTGLEYQIAKLIEVEVNKDTGSVTFSWLTPSTSTSVNPQECLPDGTLIPNPSKTYTLKVEIVDFLKWLETYPDKKELTPSDMKDVFSVAAIRVWSSSPSFFWQGMDYYLSVLDGAIHPTDIAPKHWNADNLHGNANSFADKHLGALLSGLKFFYPQMAKMVTQKLTSEGIL